MPVVVELVELEFVLVLPTTESEAGAESRPLVCEEGGLETWVSTCPVAVSVFPVSSVESDVEALEGEAPAGSSRGSSGEPPV